MSLVIPDILAPVKDGMAATDRVLREEILQGEVEPVARMMEHILQFSGKRVRPALVHLSGGLVGARNHELAVIGAMLEALHMATLLHDDVIDGATVRRRVPTLNALYDDNRPILLGDLIYARTFDLSLKLPTLEAAVAISRMTQDVCCGEIEQSFTEFEHHHDEERYYRIIRGKTAAMFRTGCELGVRYGGGTDEQARAMSDFGLDLGTAFQIIDDCLDVVGDERVAGKSLGTDLETGKVTLPIIRLARTLDARGLADLREILESEGGHRRERLRERFDLDAPVAECHQVANAHLESCLARLDAFPPGPQRQGLSDLCTFVLERSH